MSSSLLFVKFARYEDNFVGEDLELRFKTVEGSSSETPVKGVRRINRRDAARAVAQALVNPDLQGKTVQVWTDVVG
jgi:hypothetical protein